MTPVTQDLALFYDYENKVIRLAEGCTNSKAASDEVIGARRALLNREIQLRMAFQTFIDQVKNGMEHISIETGVCCCGDEMEGHNVYGNHAPRDEGEYYMTTIIIDAEEALQQ